MNIMKLSVGFFGLFSVASLSSSLNAQVSFIGVQKTQFYDQTTENTAPTTADSFSVFAFANTTSAGDAESFTVVDNDTIDLTNSASDPTSFEGSNFYTSKALMDAGFTAGDVYTITAAGGTLNGSSDTLPVPTDAYPALAYLPGTGLSSALTVNPQSAYTVNVAYTSSGTSTSTSFNIFDSSGNNVYSVSGDATQAAYVIPASLLATLTPGDVYVGQVTDFNTVGSTTTGAFSSAGNSDGFTQSTSFNLEVVAVPEPSNVLLLGLGAVALFVMQRRVRVQKASLSK